MDIGKSISLFENGQTKEKFAKAMTLKWNFSKEWERQVVVDVAQLIKPFTSELTLEKNKDYNDMGFNTAHIGIGYLAW